MSLNMSFILRFLTLTFREKIKVILNEVIKFLKEV
jgi:hypothetical protein